MLDFDSYRELRNGKRYNTNSGQTVSENGSTEDNRAGNSLENIEEEIPEIGTLTQEAVNEQIKGFITPLTRQLEEMTRLVQGMVKKPHQSHYPWTDYSTIFGAVIYQPDTARLDNRKKQVSHFRVFLPPGLLQKLFFAQTTLRLV